MSYEEYYEYLKKKEVWKTGQITDFRIFINFFEEAAKF